MEVNDLFPEGLDVNEALKLLRTVAVYVVGMAIYAVFIFKFYRLIASRDMFASDMSKYPRLRAYFHIVLFPLFAFFWFAVLTIILAFLSEKKTFEDVLLVALATIGTIRITSYYQEDLSRDLAKILPFAVLVIFLIDVSSFEINKSLDTLKNANNHREDIFYYLIFLIILEFALRLATAIAASIVAARDRRRGMHASAGADNPSSSAQEPPPAEGAPDND